LLAKELCHAVQCSPFSPFWSRKEEKKKKRNSGKAAHTPPCKDWLGAKGRGHACPVGLVFRRAELEDLLHSVHLLLKTELRGAAEKKKGWDCGQIHRKSFAMKMLCSCLERLDDCRGCYYHAAMLRSGKPFYIALVAFARSNSSGSTLSRLDMVSLVRYGTYVQGYLPALRLLKVACFQVPISRCF
jgi:hypothetical protein